MATDKKQSNLIELMKGNKSFPVLDLVRSSPITAAAISKLVVNNNNPIKSFDNKGNRDIAPPNQTAFQSISKGIVDKTADAENSMQLFPDLELSAQILISSIISPKDMMGGDVTYALPDTALAAKTGIAGTLMGIISSYFDHTYKIKPIVPKMLRDVLFQSGAYPVAVLPESTVDDLINGHTKISTESLASYVGKDGSLKSTGLLGNPTKPLPDNSGGISMENFEGHKTAEYQDKLYIGKNAAGQDEYESLVRISDNPQLLKFPQLFARAKADRVTEALSSTSKLGRVKNNVKTVMAMEGYNGDNQLNDAQMQQLVFKNQRRDGKTFVRVRSADELTRDTIGKPLVMKLPSESVIPVHVPGNEQDHLGYFVLIDNEGNPLSRNSMTSTTSDLQSRLNGGSKDMSSYLLSKANQQLGDGNCTQTFAQTSKIYESIIEADLLGRLRNSIYGNNIALARNEEVYRVMLARRLNQQATQLIYLPASMVTYFAHKYNPNGTGKSLMADMNIINSMRAMTLMARVMASLKNSVGKTVVDLKLDENDPDPTKSIELAMHEVAKTRSQYFPLGLTSPQDLTEWLRRSGFEFTFQSHPALPDVTVTFTEKAANYVVPDEQLDESLRRRSIQALGMSPEMVDGANGVDFAITAVQNNLLLAKNVLQIQESVVPKLTELARMIAKADGNLLSELRAVLMDSYKTYVKTLIAEDDIKRMKEEQGIDINQASLVEHVLQDFLNNFELGLPSPDPGQMTNQQEAFEGYVRLLDLAIEYYISSEFVTSEIGGEAAMSVDAVKKVIKAYFMRKWMAENNILPEMAQMSTVDDTGKPMLDFAGMQETHLTAIVQSVTEILKLMKKVTTKTDKTIGDLNVDASGPDADAGSDTGDAGGTDDGLGGLGDFGGLDTAPPAGEETPTDTPPGEDEVKTDDITEGKGTGLPDLDTLPDPT